MADLQASRRADLELAQRSLRGDETAQAAIFDAHCRHVHRIAFRILGTNRDIDDVIQDTFLEVFRSLASYRGEAQLSTWIQRIAARVAIRVQIARRALGRRLTLVEADVADEAATAPDRRTVMREAVRRLYLLLDAVPAASRAAFILHVVDGRSLAEVAQTTGASVIATKLRVWRTRQRIETAAARDPLLAPFVDRERRSTHGEGEGS